ncbi:MAG: hypothetical protein GDA52_00520 [Rhodobacteraceae bacterium]|nr:hypothetical protein [Paracoccaceae bacterium]
MDATLDRAWDEYPAPWPPARMGEKLKKKLSTLIEDRLRYSPDVHVRVTAIELARRTRKIYIDVEIGTGADPEKIAGRYFGLTRKVHEALGEDWEDFYAHITPICLPHADA